MRVTHEAMTPQTGATDCGRIFIRRAHGDDAPELAQLAGELCYPTGSDEMRQRLEMIGARPDDAVFVAGRDAGAAGGPGSSTRRSEAPMLGWVHVARVILLESGECAEILGLVVDGHARRGGVGRRLVTVAEEWSRALGLGRIVVRSHAARVAAHRFYPALAYVLAKTQRVYGKQLD